MSVSHFPFSKEEMCMNPRFMSGSVLGAGDTAVIKMDVVSATRAEVQAGQGEQGNKLDKFK